MKKAKTVKVPEIYAGLDLTKSGLEKCLVVDKNRQLFLFDNGSTITIIRDAIAHQFAGWETLEKAPQVTFDEMHQLAFGVAKPDKTDRVEASVYVWKKLCMKAADRTAVGNPINQPEATDVKTKAKLATRQYFLGTKSEDATVVASIHTPQAKVCYQILVDGVRAHEGKITETDLKALVNTRAAEIKTRQDPWRIFQYYRPTLIKAGLCRHD